MCTVDPDANLKEQIRIAKQIIQAIDKGEEIDMFERGDRLAELVIALDEWITRGGFIPGRWVRS